MREEVPRYAHRGINVCNLHSCVLKYTQHQHLAHMCFQPHVILWSCSSLMKISFRRLLTFISCFSCGSIRDERQTESSDPTQRQHVPIVCLFVMRRPKTLILWPFFCHLTELWTSTTTQHEALTRPDTTLHPFQSFKYRIFFSLPTRDVIFRCSYVAEKTICTSVSVWQLQATRSS